MAATNSSFATKLLHDIAKEESAQNLIFSPASIQACLALTYLGAEGKTADEIKDGIHLDGANKEEVAKKYANLLAKTKDGGEKLRLANRLYVDRTYELSPKFNELASQYFESAAESITFADAAVAAGKINAWVEENTENKIKNLISEASLDADTAVVLVNAIYFKASWMNTFGDYNTEEKSFSISKTESVKVQMMYQKDDFLYGDLKDLNATAIQMDFIDTDITMLILLPKEVDGLQSLEGKLKDVNLIELSKQLKEESVRLSLPKFKIEFEISLQPVLERLNMKTMFTSAADFSSLVTSNKPLKISEVKHKAFIDVNETGIEAAAATYVKACLYCMKMNEVVYDFVVDHPFVFAIKDKENVYFAGHINKL